jgi:hemolysin III
MSEYDVKCEAMKRVQTRREELANCLLHGAGALASLAALPVLIAAASGHRDVLHLLGSAVFGLTLVLLYLASTIYHALPTCAAKRTFRLIDHSAIYLLIAGTYTPFAFGPLRGPWGWTLLAVAWTLAIAGIVSKVTLGFRYPRLSTVLYLAMGWAGVLFVEPMLANMSTAGVLWLLAGGLCYTGGVIFFAFDARVRFAHAAWHVCVLAGSGCHFLAVLRHSVPALT